jgi:peptidoglycan/LPS O-acetylase OafA/YrhL
VIYGSGSTFADNNFAVVWGLLLLPFIAFNVRQRSSRTDRHLGNLSYVIYLVHFPVTRVVSEMLGRGMTPPEKLVYFVLVMALSLLLYFLLDAPFEIWRHRMLHGMQKALSFQNAKR